MGKWLERVIEKKDLGDNNFYKTPKSNTDNTDTMAVPAKPMKSGGRLDFIDHLTEMEREYYLDLLEIMQSPKFSLDRETAEQKAGEIVVRNRQRLQSLQASKDFDRDGFIKIFSTVLGRAVYLVRDEGIASLVPDRSLPVFTIADMDSLKGLRTSEALIMLEAKVLFDGSIPK